MKYSLIVIIEKLCVDVKSYYELWLFGKFFNFIFLFFLLHHSMDRTDKYYVYTIKSNKSLRRKDFCKFRNKNSVSKDLKFEIQGWCGILIFDKYTYLASF